VKVERREEKYVFEYIKLGEKGTGIYMRRGEGRMK
jgi:hypothetical protein